jgi:hypothetical protein
VVVVVVVCARRTDHGHELRRACHAAMPSSVVVVGVVDDGPCVYCIVWCFVFVYGI